MGRTHNFITLCFPIEVQVSLFSQINQLKRKVLQYSSNRFLIHLLKFIPTQFTVCFITILKVIFPSIFGYLQFIGNPLIVSFLNCTLLDTHNISNRHSGGLCVCFQVYNYIFCKTVIYLLSNQFAEHPLSVFQSQKCGCRRDLSDTAKLPLHPHVLTSEAPATGGRVFLLEHYQCRLEPGPLSKGCHSYFYCFVFQKLDFEMYIPSQIRIIYNPHAQDVYNSLQNILLLEHFFVTTKSFCTKQWEMIDHYFLSRVFVPILSFW